MAHAGTDGLCPRGVVPVRCLLVRRLGSMGMRRPEEQRRGGFAIESAGATTALSELSRGRSASVDEPPTSPTGLFLEQQTDAAAPRRNCPLRPAWPRPPTFQRNARYLREAAERVRVRPTCPRPPISCSKPFSQVDNLEYTWPLCAWPRGPPPLSYPRTLTVLPVAIHLSSRHVVLSQAGFLPSFPVFPFALPLSA